MSSAPGPVLAPAAGGLGVSTGSIDVSPGATGIQVATGDSRTLLSSGIQLSHLGQMLEDHSSVVRETAGLLAPLWSGQAAGGYQELSSIVHAHFRAAAATSRAAAAALRRYSAELDRCQHEGTLAVRQAEACLREIHDQTALLRAAQITEGVAQGALSAAQAQATAARAAGPIGAPVASAANAQATVEQGRLRTAQADIQKATRALTHAHEELAMWQGRGRRAWEEAQNAADQATGSLQALSIAPPPLAGVAAIPLLSPAPPYPLPPGVAPVNPSGASSVAVPLVGSLILPKKKGRGGPGKVPTGPKRPPKDRRPEGDAPPGPNKSPYRKRPPGHKGPWPRKSNP
ncbi:MAG: hypothetical protein M3071_12250 [Actinomycetota bacterium]|nr:hypothetical protein [Actinomycetota bacterium]